MAKKTTTPTAPEHTSIEPIRGNQVRLIAEKGWILHSKHTGKSCTSTITSHVAGWDVLEL